MKNHTIFSFFVKHKTTLTLSICLVAATMFSGCGLSSSKQLPETEPQLTVTPTPEPEPTAEADSDLVDMQVTAKKAEAPAEQVSYEIGTKTETSSSFVLENQTGDSIATFYLRIHPNEDYDDEDEWNENLINGAFTVANGEKLRCYYDKDQASVLYDIRVGYIDENKNECFFRSLPLQTVERITLRMDGSGEDAIPYATYLVSGSTKELSTLNEVKRRLGLLDNDLDSIDQGDSEMQADVSTYTPTPAAAAVEENVAEAAETPSAATGTGEETTSTNETDSVIVVDTGEIVGDSDSVEGAMATAREYIGQPLSSLEAEVGTANSHDYEDEPGLGMTGYHYYSSFTVSTAVDEDGSEVVMGVR